MLLLENNIEATSTRPLVSIVVSTERNRTQHLALILYKNKEQLYHIWVESL